MNIIFDNMEKNTQFLDLFQSDYEFKDLYIDDRVFDTLDKACKQFEDAESSSKLNIGMKNNKVGSNPSPTKFDSIICEYSDQTANNYDLLYNDRPYQSHRESNHDCKSVAKTMSCSSNKNTCQVKNQCNELTDKVFKHSPDSSDQPKLKNNENTLIEAQANTSSLPSIQASTDTEIIVTKSQRKRKTGYSRWGQKEDCLLFKNLTQLCKESDISIEDYWNNIFLSDQHLYILESIVDKLKWKRDPSMLLKRVQILGRDQSISVRQKHLLRKLYYQTVRQEQVFTIEGIADMFPGKSIPTLESAFEKIKENFRPMFQ